MNMNQDASKIDHEIDSNKGGIYKKLHRFLPLGVIIIMLCLSFYSGAFTVENNPRFLQFLSQPKSNPIKKTISSEKIHKPTGKPSPTIYYVPTPTINPDPLITCNINPNCSPKLMKTSSCNRSTCCHIGNDWSWYDSTDQCDMAQKSYAQKNSPIPVYLTNKNTTVWCKPEGVDAVKSADATVKNSFINYMSCLGRVQNEFNQGGCNSFEYGIYMRAFDGLNGLLNQYCSNVKP